MINREEKIEFLKDQINHCQVVKRHALYDEINIDEVDLNLVNYHQEILERELKLLQLPKRTLKTLEVSDYVEFEYEHRFYDWETEMPTYDVNGVVEEIEDGSILVDEEWYDYESTVQIYKIIPHEALTLISEILEGGE